PGWRRAPDLGPIARGVRPSPWFCARPGSRREQNIVLVEPRARRSSGLCPSPHRQSRQGPQPPLPSLVALPPRLLLVTLAPPDAPPPDAVRRYLREFLGDPRVIDIPALGRALLLNLIILPTRPAKSAHAYASIWDAERGSPLMFHSQDLAAAVAAQLGPAWHVELAMRYGRPSLGVALHAFAEHGVDRIIVFPLFPQYATSSTGTAVARVMELAAERWNVPALDFVPAFYDDPGFLTAFEQVARPALADLAPDHVLFSFHGLPVRQIRKSDHGAPGCLAREPCCDEGKTPYCYRAQSFATARALASRRGLPADRYTVCFQSRLGRIPWIEPHTDHLIDRLARSGVKKL